MENNVEIVLNLPKSVWSDYSKMALKLGFTGQEFLTLACLFDAEFEMSLQRFTEMQNIPKWAYDKFDEQFKQNCLLSADNNI